MVLKGHANVLANVSMSFLLLAPTAAFSSLCLFLICSALLHDFFLWL